MERVKLENTRVNKVRSISLRTSRNEWVYKEAERLNMSVNKLASIIFEKGLAQYEAER